MVRNLGWWPVWDTPGYSYTTGYSGLFQYAGYLYYNTATEIRKLSLSTGEDSLVYAPNTSAGYVYGIRNHNGVLQYSIAKKPERGRQCLMRLWTFVHIQKAFPLKIT
ncbi:MAG: hypothetical protein V8S08_11585 [Lachnoclostridium sp.]